MDELTLEEKKIFEYFRNHPGQNWLDAAIDLNMDCICLLEFAMQLVKDGWLEADQSDKYLTRFSPSQISMVADEISIPYPSSNSEHS